LSGRIENRKKKSSKRPCTYTKRDHELFKMMRICRLCEQKKGGRMDVKNGVR